MLILLFVVAVVATGDLSAQAGTYEIKELGSPWPEDPLCPQQTPNTNATAINEQGDVVGVAEREYVGTDGFCHYEQHAVIWHPDDTITDLGEIGRAAGEVHTTRFQFHHEEQVECYQTAFRPDFHGRKVDGGHHVPMCL